MYLLLLSFLSLSLASRCISLSRLNPPRIGLRLRRYIHRFFSSTRQGLGSLLFKENRNEIFFLMSCEYFVQTRRKFRGYVRNRIPVWENLAKSIPPGELASDRGRWETIAGAIDQFLGLSLKVRQRPRIRPANFSRRMAVIKAQQLAVNWEILAKGLCVRLINSLGYIRRKVWRCGRMAMAREPLSARPGWIYLEQQKDQKIRASDAEFSLSLSLSLSLFLLIKFQRRWLSEPTSA